MPFWDYAFESLAFDDTKNNAELIKRTMECLGYNETESSSLDEFGMEGPAWNPAWNFNWDNTTVLDYESGEFSTKKLLSLLNMLFCDISVYYVRAFGNSISDYYSGIEITYDVPTLTYTEREINYCYGEYTVFGRSAKSDDLKKEGTMCRNSKIQKNEIYESLSPQMIDLLIKNATKKGYQELVDLVNNKIVKQIEFDGVLFYASVTDKNYVVPDGVKVIGKEAFKDKTNLVSVTIPNSVTSIGDGAFVRCTSLTSITIPNSVTSIGWYAFKGCENLTSITIPKSVEIINEEAFYGCKALKNITILNPKTKLAKNVFGRFPDAWYDSIPEITIQMSYSDIIKYVKWNKLTTEIQAKIIMTHKGKLIGQYYSKNITDKNANEIAQVMSSLLNEKTERKECDAVISFVIGFRNALSDDSVKLLFDTLNTIPKGKQALQKCNLTNIDSIRNYIDETDGNKTSKKK